VAAEETVAVETAVADANTGDQSGETASGSTYRAANDPRARKAVPHAEPQTTPRSGDETETAAAVRKPVAPSVEPAAPAREPVSARQEAVVEEPKPAPTTSTPAVPPSVAAATPVPEPALVEATPADTTRAANDPREVRRRQREAKLQQEGVIPR